MIRRSIYWFKLAAKIVAVATLCVLLVTVDSWPSWLIVTLLAGSAVVFVAWWLVMERRLDREAGIR